MLNDLGTFSAAFWTEIWRRGKSFRFDRSVGGGGRLCNFVWPRYLLPHVRLPPLGRDRECVLVCACVRERGRVCLCLSVLVCVRAMISCSLNNQCDTCTQERQQHFCRCCFSFYQHMWIDTLISQPDIWRKINHVITLRNFHGIK